MSKIRELIGLNKVQKVVFIYITLRDLCYGYVLVFI